MGALNRHEMHCRTGLPLEGVGTALWTRWRGSPKLKHSESRMAARWGRLDDRLSNGAASKANWKTVHPLRRIGRKGRDGKGTTETEEVPSRYGSPATSTLGTNLPGHGEPRACSRQPFARPQQQTTKRGMARLRVVPAHGHRNTTSRRWRSRP